jgi:hypothetical protein
MAFDNTVQSINAVSGADYSASQYLFVTMASDGEIDPVGAAGLPALGVLYNAPSAKGIAAEVAISGIVKVKAGAPFNAGVLIMSSAAGKAVTATSGNRILGMAVTPAAADGDIVSVLLQTFGRVA